MKSSILLAALGFFKKRHPLIEKVHQEGIAFMDPTKTPGETNPQKRMENNFGGHLVVFFFRFFKPNFGSEKKVNIHGYTWIFQICNMSAFWWVCCWWKGTIEKVSALLKRLNMKDFSCHVGEVTRGIFWRIWLMCFNMPKRRNAGLCRMCHSGFVGDTAG